MMMLNSFSRLQQGEGLVEWRAGGGRVTSACGRMRAGAQPALPRSAHIRSRWRQQGLHTQAAPAGRQSSRSQPPSRCRCLRVLPPSAAPAARRT